MKEHLNDIGLLILRLSLGLIMAFSHGWGKLQTLFGGGEIQFPDPLGMGSTASMALAGGAEFFCSLLLVLGLFTRPVLLPLIFTMGIAAFVIHADDPFQKQEFALLYMLPYIALLFTGPGRFSLDALCRKKRAASKGAA